MIWAKVKLWAAAAAGIVMAVLYALLQKEKKERAQDELGDEQAARAVEAKAHRETMDGLKKEDEIRNEKPVNRPGADDFS